MDWYLLFGVPQAIAQPAPIPPHIRAHFTPGTLQRLTIDLNPPSSSEQFFKAGRVEFEQEIQRLTDPRSTDTLLKVSPTLSLPQNSFPTESPNRENPPGQTIIQSPIN